MNIPTINNPAGIPSNAITEDEFLHLRGVGYVVSGFVDDKLRCNRALKTQRGTDSFNREVEKANTEYYAVREEAKKEYRSLIAQGVIRDKTSIERRIVKAHGHPDNQSTQAARRMLTKRGIDWKTGKKL